MIQEIRNKNISIIKKRGFVINKNLPLIENEIKVQKLNKIGGRVDILHLLYTISIEGVESKKFFYDIMKSSNLIKYLSKSEYNLMEKDKLTTQDVINMSWSKEAIYALLWCVGLVEDLEVNINEINISEFYELIPPEKNKKLFLKSLVLRPKLTLLKMIDFYYVLHSALKRVQTSKENNHRISIVRERRKALEWLVYGYNWDNIPLDT